MTVTGHTKSGKTVLVRKILPKEKTIWIDGGGIRQEDDFWNSIIDQLRLFQTVASTESLGKTAEFSTSAKAGADFLIAKGEAEIMGALGTERVKETSTTRTVSARTAALAGLSKTLHPMVIDDFHYISRDLQGDLVRSLKPLIFEGCPIVIIAIPHRRYHALKV